MFMCIYVFDKVLNCFWNLYSSLCSFCGCVCLFVDRCVTSGASLFQDQTVESGAKWSGGEKRKKGIGREEGFFPFSPCPHRFFSAAFLCTVPTTRTPGIGSSVASILGSGRKKIASHADVLRGTSCVPAPSTNNVCVGGYKNERQQNYIYLRLGVFF